MFKMFKYFNLQLFIVFAIITTCQYVINSHVRPINLSIIHTHFFQVHIRRIYLYSFPYLLYSTTQSQLIFYQIQIKIATHHRRKNSPLAKQVVFYRFQYTYHLTIHFTEQLSTLNFAGQSSLVRAHVVTLFKRVQKCK